ncbi:LysR family transcriptional regulator [Mesorhizobium sp. WSM1497]|uniref:LysR family transcriptional regulator n=1 Tax=Mesorhizobium sp. WSM1497 TaxID=278153 RepID=UPI0007ECB3DE|nr:LysR family transcriptional regulator [Mesorhizobium sp. WSM1497]ARP64315.1 LysR family transcriptional regulator [Mesorhizobium sp. WSM1497]
MRRRVQLVTLDCALVIAEEGSFLAASRRLGIHHSALSRRIRDLEHSLGTALFERHSGGVRPTLAGAGLLRNLRRVLADLDGTLTMVRTARDVQGGSPATGLEAPLHATEILDAVTDVIRSRPDVSLRLVETKRGAARSP